MDCRPPQECWRATVTRAVLWSALLQRLPAIDLAGRYDELFALSLHCHGPTPTSPAARKWAAAWRSPAVPGPGMSTPTRSKCSNVILCTDKALIAQFVEQSTLLRFRARLFANRILPACAHFVATRALRRPSLRESMRSISLALILF